jgi:hypothetical protein
MKVSIPTVAELESNQAIFSNTLLKLIEDCKEYKEVTDGTLSLVKHLDNKINVLTQALSYTQEAVSINNVLIKQLVLDREKELGDRK